MIGKEKNNMIFIVIGLSVVIIISGIIFLIYKNNKGNGKENTTKETINTEKKIEEPDFNFLNTPKTIETTVFRNKPFQHLTQMLLTFIPLNSDIKKLECDEECNLFNDENVLQLEDVDNTVKPKIVTVIKKFIEIAENDDKIVDASKFINYLSSEFGQRSNFIFLLILELTKKINFELTNTNYDLSLDKYDSQYNTLSLTDYQFEIGYLKLYLKKLSSTSGFEDLKNKEFYEIIHSNSPIPNLENWITALNSLCKDLNDVDNINSLDSSKNLYEFKKFENVKTIMIETKDSNYLQNFSISGKKYKLCIGVFTNKRENQDQGILTLNSTLFIYKDKKYFLFVDNNLEEVDAQSLISKKEEDHSTLLIYRRNIAY